MATATTAIEPSVKVSATRPMMPTSSSIAQVGGSRPLRPCKGLVSGTNCGRDVDVVRGISPADLVLEPVASDVMR